MKKTFYFNEQYQYILLEDSACIPEKKRDESLNYSGTLLRNICKNVNSIIINTISKCLLNQFLMSSTTCSSWIYMENYLINFQPWKCFLRLLAKYLCASKEKGRETNTFLKIFCSRHCASYMQYIGKQGKGGRYPIGACSLGREAN